MNKNFSITINGLFFHIEEDAYPILDHYLASIRKHFASYEEHDEIVNDIETRIAEQFSAKLTNAKSVINKNDVEELIKVMGTVEDFKKFDAETHTGKDKNGHARSANTVEDKNPNGETTVEEQNPKNKIPKKLFRNPDDKIIAGVASGIATYLGIDPVFIRLLFIILALANGFGIIIYIILWIVMTEAKTPAQKMKMRGENITISDIEEKFSPSTKNQNAQPGVLNRLFMLPFKLLKTLLNLFKKLIPWVGKIIGFFVVIGTIIGLLVITFPFLALLFGIGNQYTDIPIRDFMSGTDFYLGLFAAYFLLLIPTVFLAFIGTSLFKSKNILNSKTIIGLVIVWVAAGMTAGLLGLKITPEVKANMEQFLSNYQNHSKNFDPKYFSKGINDFSKLDLSDDYNLIIKKGEKVNITAKGSEKELDTIGIVSDSGVTSIFKMNRGSFCLICYRPTPTIEITVPNLNELTLDHVDSVNVSLEGFSKDDLTLQMINSRGGISTTNNKLSVKFTGYSNLDLDGSANQLEASVTENTDFNASHFLIQKAIVETHQYSSAEINAQQDLTAKTYDSSVIFYSNEPKLHEEISDHGRIEKLQNTANSSLIEPALLNR